MKIIATFVLTLALTLIGGYFYVDYLLEDGQKRISKLEEDQKLKLAEIAKLEGVVKSNNEKLIQGENLILNQKREIEQLKAELSYYDSLRQLDIVATAYTAFCDTGCIGITAGGTNVKNTVYKDGYRVVAVDPRIIPLGSLLHVETEGKSFVGIADDTGGDIKGNRLDVLVRNKKIAYDFGVQDVKVTVIREGEG